VQVGRTLRGLSPGLPAGQKSLAQAKAGLQFDPAGLALPAWGVIAGEGGAVGNGPGPQAEGGT